MIRLSGLCNHDSWVKTKQGKHTQAKTPHTFYPLIGSIWFTSDQLGKGYWIFQADTRRHSLLNSLTHSHTASVMSVMYLRVPARLQDGVVSRV